jgi:uncharacterized protein YecE (DUF72 family)
MGGLRIGAGGWAYFRIPGENSLKAYSSAFDFVEVNSTYYEYPSLRAVSRWRRSVPDDFEFAVRCHRNIDAALPSKRRARIGPIVNRMVPICRTLQASVLAVLVNNDGVDQGVAPGLDELLTTFNANGIRVAVEFRGGPPTDRVLKLIEKNDAIHCVDISREQPRYDSDILYTRLFGKGQDNIYEFEDDELRDIASKASAPKFEKSILAFHGVRMYRDAARLKAFLKAGDFPTITGQAGLDSLRTVLEEDARFPAEKAELVNLQGWKLFDLTSKRRVRAREYLSKLPDGTYSSLDSVISSLEGALPRESPSLKMAHARIRYSS